MKFKKFVLPEQHFIIKLLNLRSDYEAREGIILSKASQPYAVSRFFGATDVEARERQICFIEKMLIALAKDLNPHEKGFNKQKYLTALQVLVTQCFYTKSQIHRDYTHPYSSSTLSQLIDEAMTLTALNAVDPETQACCLLTSEHLQKSELCLESLNACLKKQITALEWRDFSNFVSTECGLLDEKYVVNYPITSIMMPLVAVPSKLAGYTVGWVFGNWFGKSASLLSTHTAVAMTLGSGLVFLFGPSAALGAILITPALAGQLIETYCGISLSIIMGETMNLVGNGVGFTVGMPLDLAVQLLGKTCSTITNFYQDSSTYPPLTGISLTDGVSIIDGRPIEFDHINQLTEELHKNLKSVPIIVAIEENQLIVKYEGVTKKIAIATDAQEAIEELKKLGLEQKIAEFEEGPEAEVVSRPF